MYKISIKSDEIEYQPSIEAWNILTIVFPNALHIIFFLSGT